MEFEQVYCKDEASLVSKFVELLQVEDPDVVTGHNIWGFDMKYIFIRANLIPFPTWGGQGSSSEPTSPLPKTL